MKININNYEAYFIDYLEGNLDEKLVDDFIEFLQQNPLLKEELALFDSVSLEPENVDFHKKDKLYKEKYDSEKEFDKTAVARLDGELSEKENTNFENYLSKNPEKEKEVALFNKTKLVADETIVFNKKNKIYKASLGKTVLMWSVRIAAILVLAFVFYFLADRPVDNIIPDNQVAKIEKEIPIKETPTEVKAPDQIPVKKTEKKEIKPVEKDEKSKPEIKKPEPKPKTTKSIRETTKGRMGGDDLALERIPLEVPDELKGITASLQIAQPEANLAVINRNSVEIKNAVYEERLLADVVKEKTGIDKISFNKIKMAGLNLVSNFTKDNFTYETNENGKVTEYIYDSRLFAFTIPAHNEQGGE